jgi:GTP pyrophosphokinase
MSISEKFSEALVLAASLHRGQRRKGGGAPYIAHLLAVAATVIEFGGTEDQAIAGLLHDAVEDQGGAATREVIRRMFGETVADIVDACTDTDVEPKPPWRERKEAFIDSLGAVPAPALLVILADKLHNAQSTLRDLRTSGDGVWTRFRGGRDGTLWYYRAIAGALRPVDAATAALGREYALVVAELEAAAGARR